MSVGRWWRPAAAALTGGLLAAAFPPLETAEAAWFALAPLLWIARGSSVRAAFAWGWGAGFLFWLLTLAWLLRLVAAGGPLLAVAAGWLLLAAYCALYLGLFAAVAAWLLGGGEAQGTAAESGWHRLGAALALPLVWVGLEYGRATLFTGFAWNPLGVSQYRNLAIIQLAEWGGVYAVSALVLLMNAALALTAFRLADVYRRRCPPRRHAELMVALLATALALGWGVRARLQAARREAAGAELRVAAVPLNVPQRQKWDEAAADAIYERLAELTRQAQRHAPDLIVWPETAVPYCARTDPRTRAFVEELAAEGTAILAGSMEVAAAPDGRGPDRYYNSSLLFLPGQGLAELYRKRHLVPFGEYVPGDRWWPWLARFSPLGVSCSAGATSTVFRLPLAPRAQPSPAAGGAAAAFPRPPAAFSALICFEDTIAPLAREAVRNGARLLINQTNDGWFEGSAAAVQHLSHGVFRCVENRVPAVRCANLGATCFIDSAGRIDRMSLELLTEDGGAGIEYRTDAVRLPPADWTPTFYTRYGDAAFAAPCGLLAALGVAAAAWRARRERTTGKGENP